MQIGAMMEESQELGQLALLLVEKCALPSLQTSHAKLEV